MFRAPKQTLSNQPEHARVAPFSVIHPFLIWGDLLHRVTLCYMVLHPCYYHVNFEALGGPLRPSEALLGDEQK
jgi:hypothetical protein